MNFSWRDHKKLKRNALFVLALLGLGIFIHEIVGQNGYLTYRKQKKEYNELQQQIQTLSQQNQELQQKIDALKNNSEAVEKQARDQLHLVRPGELIYVLPDRKAAQAQADTQQASRQPKPQQ